MKKIFSLSALALTLLFVSCKKDKNDVAPASAVQKKIKQTTFDENWVFSYNADGTIKEMDLPSADYKEKFVYSPGKILLNGYSAGKLSWIEDFTITNGRPEKKTSTSLDVNGQPTSIYEELYQYNAKGLLSKKTQFNDGYEEYQYDLNGNLIMISIFDNTSTQIGKTEFTYGNQADLFPQYSYLSSNMLGFVFPPRSKHLPVSEKRTSLPGNTVTFHVSLSYELDADGYVLKGKAHFLSGAQSDYNWTNMFE